MISLTSVRRCHSSSACHGHEFVGQAVVSIMTVSDSILSVLVDSELPSVYQQELLNDPCDPM
jgi:hypothetical protein